MQIRINIDKEQTRKSIVEKLKKRASSVFGSKMKLIQPAVERILYQEISKQPELDSIRNGALRVEFGLDQARAEAAAEGIARVFARSVRVNNPPLTALLTGRISLVLIKPTYDEFYSQVPANNLTSVNGFNVPWLKWLFEEAQSVRIVGWRVMHKAGGRSGEGFMIKHKGRFWSMPAPFDQPESNNLLNRVLRSRETQLEIEKAISKILN